MTLELHGKRVLVIGAASGIGEATAAAFAAAGAVMVAAGRDGVKLQEAAARMGAEAAALDILDGPGIEAFFARQAPFDHVALTAARTKTGSVASLSLPDAYAAMDSKFWGAYRVAKSVRINAGGSLTFVSGQMAVRPTVLSVLQGAINSALEGLVRGLALEMAPVRVNAVSPGLIATPLHGGLSEADRQAMFDRAARSLPARRVGQAEDIAQAILFLATNPFVTGSTLAVDGGRAVE